MPIYEYSCVNGHTFEDFRSSKEKYEVAGMECPVCGVCNDGLAEVIVPVAVSVVCTKLGALPPKASRKFGEERRTPYKMAKWE